MDLLRSLCKTPPIPFVQYRAQHDPCWHPAKGTGLFCLSIVEPPWWGSNAPIELRSVVPFRGPGSPEVLLLLLAQVPWQEQFDVSRALAPGRRAVLEMPSQPLPGIELPQRQGGED